MYSPLRNILSPLLIQLVFTGTDSANILAIVPFPTLSHSIPFVPLFQTLATEHNVTVITSNPMSINPKSSIHIIDVSEVYHHDCTSELIETLTGYNIGKHHEVFRVVIQNPDVRELILEQNNKFDLILTDVTSPIWTVFGRLYSCPVVGLLPYDVYLVHVKLGTPTNPAIHSDSTIGLNYDMNTFEKIYNIIIGLVLLTNDLFYTQEKVDYYLDEYFPPVPELETKDHQSNIAMLFVNQIPGFHKLRATADNTMYIGSGQKYIEKYGISNVDFVTPKRQNLIVVYIELDDDESQKILMKNLQELDEFILWVKHPNLPPQQSQNNIKLIEPYEFQNILHNERISLLITNGDNHLIEISLTHTIPMLVITRRSSGQEKQNAQKLYKENIAKILNVDDLTDFKSYIEDMIQHNDEYRSTIKNYSSLIQTPMSGITSAVIWIEWLLANPRNVHSQSVSGTVSIINLIESWYLDIAIVVCATILFGLGTLIFFGSISVEFITRRAASKELVY